MAVSCDQIDDVIRSFQLTSNRTIKTGKYVKVAVGPKRSTNRNLKQELDRQSFIFKILV